MNRSLFGTVISWRTRNARKMKRAEIVCADYGLKPIHKALHVGSLYEGERRAFERKFKNLLNGKRDQYCILVICTPCLKGFNATYDIASLKVPYEIV